MRTPALLTLLSLLVVPAGARAGFAPGEETVFEITYLGLRTGEGRILVGKAEGDIWPVIFQAKTLGIAGFIDVREHLVSYWDSKTNLTRGSDLKAYEVGDYHADTARFDRDTGKATVTVARKNRTRVTTIDVASNAQDLTSAFMWLRTQPLEVGQRHEIPVASGDKQFTLVAEVLGREKVEADAGTFQTLKVRVRTELDGKFSTKRDSTMWLSDDSKHVLVRASADFAVGSVVATLKRFTPGGAVAER
jgi:Protein of unknown function (DUF3108)